MRAVAAVLVAFLLWVASSAVRQARPKQSTKQNPSTQATSKQPSTQKPGEHEAAQSRYLKGRISDDGKTFIEDDTSTTWTILNPDAVKTYKGDDVRLTADTYPNKRSIRIISVGF